MRTLCVIWAAVILNCTVHIAAQTFHVKDTADSVVQIATLSPDGKGTVPAGTGFFVSADTVLSDGHVFWEAGKAANDKRIPGFLVQKSSQSSDKHFIVPLDIVKLDDVHDLVLFKFNPQLVHAQWPEFIIKPLRLADSESRIEVGQDIFLVGYFQNLAFVITLKGTLAGDTSTSTLGLGTIDEFLLSLDTNYGFSGGPVITADSGDVIGVMAGFLPNTPPAQGFANGLSRAIRLKYLKAFLPSSGAGH